MPAELAGRALNLHRPPSGVGRLHLQAVLLDESNHGLDVVRMRTVFLRKLIGVK